MAGNAAGLWLSLLLLFPGLQSGEWTYGRWMPVHLNVQLFGWTALPLTGWLSLSGLLLILSPAFVLRLLGIEELPAETVWTFTAGVRFSVAAFLAIKIASGSLPLAGAMVAAADAAVATVQVIGLKAGWWSPPSPRWSGSIPRLSSSCSTPAT